MKSRKYWLHVFEHVLVISIVLASYISVATTVVNAQFNSKPTIPSINTKENISQLQDGLQKIGYYHGKQTGKLDKTTKQAIQKFQKTNNIKPANGMVNEKTINTMISQLKNLEKTTPPPKQTSELKKEKNKSNVLSVHPTICAQRHGFDNYRTNQTFAVNPKNNQELYVNIEFKGLFKSNDSGQTWKFSGDGLEAWPRSDDPTKPCYLEYMSVHIDPINSQRILLVGGAAPGKVSEPMYRPGGLHESLDGGKSWHQLFSEDMNAYTIHAVTDPKDPKTIYVTTAALPSSNSETNQDRIFVKTGVVYKTVDGGKNWKELPTGFVPHTRVTNILMNEEDSKHLIISTTAIPPNSGGGKILENQMGLLETKDGGTTWETIKGLPEKFRAVHSFHASKNLKHLFVYGQHGQEEEQAFYSLDSGETFREVPRPVNFARFNPHDTTGKHLFGFSIYAQPNVFFESLDGGQTWNVVGKLPPEVNNENRVSNIVWDPIDQNTVFLNGSFGRVWKSTDKGKTWKLILNLDSLKG